MEKPKKILVVEDDNDLRLFMIELLEATGYEVDSANSGNKGFEKASSGDFSLILMDIRMPGWDGVETIAGLNMVNPALKFLIISGYISESYLSRLEKVPNIIDIIQKPFENNYLLRVVESCFEDG